MPRFNIYNQASATDLGTYEAATGAAALDLLAQQAGYRDAAHMREATGTDPDLIVSEVGIAPALLKRGDFITIRPEFRDPGDEKYSWLVCGDEDGDRLRITPLGTGLALPPIQTVRRTHVEPVAPQRADMAGAFLALRKAAGMTQTEVAHYLGVALRTVQGWESGEFRPNPSAYRLLAQGRIGKAEG